MVLTQKTPTHMKLRLVLLALSAKSAVICIKSYTAWVFHVYSQEGECRFKKAYVGATVTGFTDLPQGDEEKMKEAVAMIGPVSVAIDASHQSFQLYESGEYLREKKSVESVFTHSQLPLLTGVYDEEECSSTQLDHGVLVAGYGTELGLDYWLVKNRLADFSLVSSELFSTCCLSFVNCSLPAGAQPGEMKGM